MRTFGKMYAWRLAVYDLDDIVGGVVSANWYGD